MESKGIPAENAVDPAQFALVEWTLRTLMEIGHIPQLVKGELEGENEGGCYIRIKPDKFIPGGIFMVVIEERLNYGF